MNVTTFAHKRVTYLSKCINKVFKVVLQKLNFFVFFYCRTCRFCCDIQCYALFFRWKTHFSTWFLLHHRICQWDKSSIFHKFWMIWAVIRHGIKMNIWNWCVVYNLSLNINLRWWSSLNKGNGCLWLFIVKNHGHIFRCKYFIWCSLLARFIIISMVVQTMIMMMLMVIIYTVFSIF